MISKNGTDSRERRHAVQRILVNHVNAPKKTLNRINVKSHDDPKETKVAELQSAERNNTRQIARKFLKKYLSDSSVHGIQYLGDIGVKGSNILRKLFWMLIMIWSVLFLLWMVNTFWTRYQASPVRTVIENFQAPIFQAPFPAVTICPLVPPLPARRKELLQRLHLPHGIDEKMANFLLKYSAAFANERNVAGKGHLHNLRILLETNHMSLLDTMRFLRPCEDMLEGCWFEGVQLDCRELFNESYTHSGICCSFNYLLEDYINFVDVNSTDRKRYQLLKTAYFGSSSGLTVTLNRDLLAVENDTEENVRYSTNSVGVVVFCHHPLEFIDAIATRHILQAQDELRIAVSPTMKRMLNYQNNYDSTDMPCATINTTIKYFPAYLYTNCFTSCSIDISLKSCGCLPYYYAPVAIKYNLDICEWEDFECLKQNAKSIRVIHNIDNANYSCQCQNTCEEIGYNTEMSSGQLNRQEFNVAPMQRNIVETQAILRIYMISETFIVAKVIPIADELYLLASVGGIFSLFLGCSFISVIELLYFVILFFRSYYKKSQ